jgi:hypothetical protein
VEFTMVSSSESDVPNKENLFAALFDLSFTEWVTLRARAW